MWKGDWMQGLQWKGGKSARRIFALFQPVIPESLKKNFSEMLKKKKILFSKKPKKHNHK